MLDSPPARLLVAEARKALEAGLAPGFQQKVAANALGIAQRELERGPALAAAELARLAELVGDRGGLPERNARLAALIRDGRIDPDDPALIDHLIRTTVAKLEVDQPRYPAFRAWKDDG